MLSPRYMGGYSLVLMYFPYLYEQNRLNKMHADNIGAKSGTIQSDVQIDHIGSLCTKSKYMVRRTIIGLE
jgi:hypothetical protein